MRELPLDIETINAYVDGELEPDEAARVAKVIAADPQMAAIVAKLHAMKSTVGKAFSNQEIIAITPQKQAGVSAPVWAIAACLLISAIGGGYWYFLTQHSSSDIVTQAMLQHDNWLLKSRDSSSKALSVSALVTPDLRHAGLTLAGVQKNVQLGDTHGERYAYIGSRGCKLSLFVFSQSHEMAGFGEMTRPDALIVKWVVGNRGFLLVARKMNQERFNVIAKALEAATAKAVSLDEPMRQALMQSRKPCLV